ncbi:4-hydroxy-tetrahydrodipicolinate reductase [Robertkochia flava]|uniref:4-hydroxy-tetrahydrodipicolinate reductase n=1 Tax=Robertkochia flava TaxID=3447986 RepID=UPI001CCDB6B9|nr:4-hydroxy-tetrahydrodipicolinate reductase [Robertkochia marina]
MKIALIGYGRMGKMIEEIARQRGHHIVSRIKKQDALDLKDADVAIDFSVPESAFENITHCFHHNVPVISGTTGWLDRYDEALEVCRAQNGAFIYASNFSLGVNIFFELNRFLAKMMGNLETYKVAMEEIHHTQKLDAPSGTAITLAEGIIAHTPYKDWSLENPDEKSIPVKAIRTGQVPGTHTISWESAVDRIDITHTAHNREGFALGAVIAAEWLKDKKGVYSMKDVLSL